MSVWMNKFTFPYVKCLSGEWDEIEFNFFVLNYPDYDIIMMSTFSDLTVSEG